MQTLMALRDAVIKDPPTKERFESFLNSWMSLPLEQTDTIKEDTIREVLEECLEAIPCFKVYWNEYILKKRADRRYEDLLERAKDCLAEIKDKTFKEAQAELIRQQLQPKKEGTGMSAKTGGNGGGEQQEEQTKKAISDRDRKIGPLSHPP